MNVQTFTGAAKIDSDGVYRITMSAYHAQPCAGPSVSSTGLRMAFWHPAEFWRHWSFNPDHEQKRATEAMILGRAAHHLILGESGFRSQFIIRPLRVGGEPWNGIRTACKEWLAEQALAGLTVVTEEQVTKIRGMAEALSRDSLVQHGILAGEVELSLIWRHPATGIWIKSRPDAIPNASGDYADLKCLSAVDEDSLATAIAGAGYHQQLALLRESARALRLPMQTANLVCVQPDQPHSVAIRQISDFDLDRGQRQNEIALRIIRRGLDTGHWPGPDPHRNPADQISLPTWQASRIDRRIEQLEKIL